MLQNFLELQYKSIVSGLFQKQEVSGTCAVYAGLKLGLVHDVT